MNYAFSFKMSKRNVAFIKPQDPSFLRRLKEEIGYKEGPTVETKRQKLENYSDSEEEGCGEATEDEKPQVVVLKAGDLTAEEADAEKKRIEKEEQEKPADLSKRIIFKTKAKSVDAPSAHGSSQKEKKKSKKSSKDSKNKLSFNDEDDDC